MGKYFERITAADNAAVEASNKWEAAEDAGRDTRKEQAASERANANVGRALLGKDGK